MAPFLLNAVRAAVHGAPRACGEGIAVSMIAVRPSGVSVEVRLAFLARMPCDAEAALERFKAQLCSVWSALDSVRAPGLLSNAVARATPPLPSMRRVPDASLDAFLSELDAALWNHHPEEICVASFAVLSNLAELVRAELGEPQLQALLDALERHPS